MAKKLEEEEDDDGGTNDVQIDRASLSLPRPSSFPASLPNKVIRAGVASTSTFLWQEFVRDSAPVPFSASVAQGKRPEAATEGWVKHYGLQLPAGLTDMSLLSRRLSDRYKQSGEGLKKRSTSLVQFAAEEAALDLALSSKLFSVRRSQQNTPSILVNASQPPSETPPEFHLSFMKLGKSRRGIGVNDAGESDEDSDAETGTRRRPSLKSFGVRSVLAEWHVGSDPKQYSWSNPYSDDDAKYDLLASYQTIAPDNGSRKKPRLQRGSSYTQMRSDFSQGTSLPVPAMSQFRSSQMPPPLLSSSMQPPAISSPRLGRATILQPSFPRPRRPEAVPSASQPVVRFQEDTQSSSQLTESTGHKNDFDAAASQVVPGAFGSREAFRKDKDKKKAKKRVSGF